MKFFPLFLGGVNIAVALLLIGFSFPLLQGRVQRNQTYGFRFPEAFESDEAWLAINRYGAQRLIFWSILLLLFGIAVPFFLPAENVVAIIAVANAPVIVVVPFIESWKFAKQYRREA
jgi:SdpI/YfhL protein family